MRRRDYLTTLGTASTGLLAGCSASANDAAGTSAIADAAATIDGPAERPNVLVILIDQLRAAALGSYGDPNAETPRLDGLASEGLQFSNAIVPNPTCSPTRAALLTGRQPWSTGVISNGSTLPPRERTIANALGDAGYQTGYIGKWHLGPNEWDRPPDYSGHGTFVPPRFRVGFEWWQPSPAGGAAAPPHYGHAVYNDNGGISWTRTDEWQPTVHTDMAIDRIGHWETTHDQPWFLQLNYSPPHPPFEAPDEFLNRFDPGSFGLRPNVPDGNADQAREWLHAYYANLWGVDREIGRVLDALDQRGIAENTLVVVTGDHGSMLRSHGRRGKNVPFEESINVPLLMQYPAQLADRSDAIETMVSTIDIAPTIAGFAGRAGGPNTLSVTLEDDARPVQGTDLSAYLTAERFGGDDARGYRGHAAENVYLAGLIPQPHGRAWRAVRRRNWLLVVDGNLNTTHLYKISEDPYQQDNLVGSTNANSLRERLFDLSARYDDRHVLAQLS